MESESSRSESIKARVAAANGDPDQLLEILKATIHQMESAVFEFLDVISPHLVGRVDEFSGAPLVELKLRDVLDDFRQLRMDLVGRAAKQVFSGD